MVPLHIILILVTVWLVRTMDVSWSLNLKASGSTYSRPWAFQALYNLHKDCQEGHTGWKPRGIIKKDFYNLQRFYI